MGASSVASYPCTAAGEQLQEPERTAEHLSFLARAYRMDSLHFYDNNFFVKEDHARELAGRIAPLGLKWWCEARVDALTRFSDDTWSLLKRAGLTMVFCGAESGIGHGAQEDAEEGATTAQILEVAARSRRHGIIPEFSFVFGDPDEPEREIDNTLAFIRRLKHVNPAMELISYFYTPTPQRRGTYGGVDAMSGTPATLEEWIKPAWVAWMTHEDPLVPWLDTRLKAKVTDFEVVLKSRFPSVQDRKDRRLGQGPRPDARTPAMVERQLRESESPARRPSSRHARARRQAGVRAFASGHVRVRPVERA